MRLSHLMSAVIFFVVAGDGNSAGFNPNGVRKLMLEPRTLDTRATISQEVLAQLNARLLRQYEALAVISVSEAMVDSAISRGQELGYVTTELNEIIYLPSGKTIDPRVDPPSAFRYPNDIGAYLLQFVAPPGLEWQEEVLSLVKIAEELHERSIVVLTSLEKFERLRELSFIQFGSVYAPDFKFAPSFIDPEEEYVIQFSGIEGFKASVDLLREKVGGFIYEVNYHNKFNARARLTPLIAQLILSDPYVLGIEKYVPLRPSDERQVSALFLKSPHPLS